jgi:acetylornithine deacetylase/succinyl-diaminopimelate desuccinylase-like protein
MSHVPESLGSLCRKGAWAGLFALPVLICGTASGQQLTRHTIDSLAEAKVPMAFELFREYLSIPNDAHYPNDIRKVNAWLDGAFRARGFQTVELPTGGSPLLLAERSSPEAERTVLFYLQADGQPVSPSHWEQEDPYTPVLKAMGADGTWQRVPWSELEDDRDDELRIFARSASDSKGPNVQFLVAVDAMDDAGVIPDFNIKVIVDMEEEIGSPHLPDAVQRFRNRLSADMLVILDGPPHISHRPTLKFGARGIATFTVTTFGPRVPLHSGHYGNYVPNPALRLAQILASLKDERGRVTIAGFYDGVELDATTRAALALVPDDEVAIREKLGISETDDVGTSLQEAVQYPSLNIRGLSSGWVGAQRRTIVPATATAEVDIRLVLETDPVRLLRLVRDHIEGLGYHVIDRPPTDEERRTHPKIASLTSEVSYRAFRTSFDSAPGRWLSAALEHLYGKKPIQIRTSGGSIPISPFVSTLDVPAVIVPTVNPDNNQHSPNENIRVGDFVEGIKVVLAVLTQPMGSD